MKKKAFRAARSVAGIAFLFVVGACGTASPGPAPQVVQVQVPTSCVPSDFPAKPVFTDNANQLKSAPDMAARDALIKGNWGVHQEWERELEKLWQDCLKVAQ